MNENETACPLGVDILVVNAGPIALSPHVDIGPVFL